MIHFWRLHWFWCCCVLHSNLLVAGDEEMVPMYKTREPIKLPPKFDSIMKDTHDVRRTGSDIVKKSNDHLERQTAPNRPSRDSQSDSNRTEIDQSTEDLSNASRNARDLSYDTIATNDTTLIPTDDNTTAGILLQNDSVYSVASNSEVNSSDSSVAKTATVSSVILKNPKDKENKTKLDSSSFVKKVTINKQSKNATESMSDKPKILDVLNNTRDNSTDYVSGQSLNETSHNYNVTVDSPKNITLSGLADEEHNETKISATSRRTMPDSPPLSTLNIALITVAAFAVVSAVSVIGMVSVVLYRRYHWNKPQTLSDKCSNADSTGYIDDSTLKENSEEMYSLDNDSFLNSLEAMTIQNYWADSIRHTKL